MALANWIRCGFQIQQMWICVMLISCCVCATKEPISLTFTTSEGQANNTLIGSIVREAKLKDDFDESTMELLQFSIAKGDHKELFNIIGNRGQLRTNAVIDREAICPQALVCVINLDVTLIYPIEHFQIFRVKINLLDINDNSPKFARDRITLNISENAIPGASFVIPSASDLDSGDFGVQDYDFESEGNILNLNAIAVNDLRLVLNSKLDRERQEFYTAKVTAWDKGQPPKNGTLIIDIRVVDANDNNPVFEQDIYETTVAENTPLGKEFVHVHANDADKGENAAILYGFHPQTQQDYGSIFGINASSGGIYLKQNLDYETVEEYTLMLTAKDQGPDATSTLAKIIIHVTDVNDFAPKITVNSMTSDEGVVISEWADENTFVAHISVDDLDKGQSGDTTCSLDDDNFSLEQLYETEYKLVTLTTFDYETRASYTVTIICEDNGSPPLETEEEITIHVQDENDHTPVFSKEVYEASLGENNSAHSPVTVVSATDGDSGTNGEIEYILHDNAQGKVKINPSTGVITTNAVFDHETLPYFRFNVIAMDRGSPRMSTEAEVSLTIMDENDEVPVFDQSSYSFGTYENQSVNTEIGVISATDKDDPPNDKFTFSFDPNHSDIDTFSIDPFTGKITIKKMLDRENKPEYKLLVIARNTAFPQPSSTVSVSVYIADINDNAPRIIFPTIQNDSIEVPINAPMGHIFTRIQAQDADIGDNAKLTYSIAKGNDEGFWDIDPNTGAIAVQVDLKTVTVTHQTLLIEVTDSGHPMPQSAVSTLNIKIVHKSATFGDNGVKPMAHVAGFLGKHERIIIYLGCVTAVMVLILITAIVCIKMRQRRQEKESYRYMCRVDQTTPHHEGTSVHHNVGHNPETPDSPNHSFDKSHIRMSDPADNIPRMADPTNPLSPPPPPYEDPEGKNNFTLEDLQHMRNTHGSKQNIRQHRNISSPCSPEFNIPMHPQYGGTDKEAEMHQLLQLLKRDGDTESTSGCSGEVSIADSGKGTSEDGENLRHKHMKNIPKNRLPERTKSPSRGRLLMSPQQHYPPSPGQCQIPNSNTHTFSPKMSQHPAAQTCTCLNNSYSLDRKDYNRSNGVICGCHGDTGNHNQRPPTNNHHKQPRGTSDWRPTMSPIPALKQPEPISDTQNYVQMKTFRPVNHTNVSGLNSSGRSSNISDDGGSSTSGSYVIELDHPPIKTVDV